MFKQKLFSVLVASSILVPATFTVNSAANAQQFINKNSIVNGLQIQQPKLRKKSRKRAPVNTFRAPASNNGQVAKRRAPTQQFRAPSSNNGQVAVRRAPQGNQQLRVPQNNNRKRVAKRRAPTVQQFRAPSSNNGQVAVRRAPQGNQQLRVPQQRVVKRRAPTVQQFRAPANNGQVAVRRAPLRVAKRRAPANNPQTFAAPDRNPQRFNQQVASNGKFSNERAIRLEQKVSDYYDNASSIDLEILFDYNSAEISLKSVRQLFVLGEALQDASLKGTRILIAGHTDAAGSNNYNANLSYLRAQSVFDFLIEYSGVSADRLAIEGYGEELLKYPDAPNSGQNRRVEIINLGS